MNGSAKFIDILTGLSQDQFDRWLSSLLFGPDREDPPLFLGRDETVDTALLDVYQVLDLPARRRFASAVDKCLDTFPQEAEYASALQVLTQLVQFTVPRNAKARLDYFLESDYLCRLRAANHSLRYWMLSARCVYGLDGMTVHYILKYAPVENDADYTSRFLAVLIKSKLNDALSLLPQVFTHLTSNSLQLNQWVYHSRKILEMYDGPGKVTSWLSSHEQELSKSPTVASGFNAWREAIWKFATDPVTLTRHKGERDWIALIRVVQPGHPARPIPTMREMEIFIQKKIEELHNRCPGTRDDDYKDAANEFERKFSAAGSDGVRLESLFKSEQIPVTIRTEQQLYALGCWEQTYRGGVLKCSETGSLSAMLGVMV